MISRRRFLKTAGAFLVGSGAGLRGAATVNPVKYVDVASCAGISFQHDNAASHEKYLIETMGSGCGWIDYDQNGLLEWLNLTLGLFCKRRRQPFVVECGAERVLHGVNQDKFHTFHAGLAIPEAILLGDPVWSDIRDVHAMAQVPRKKLLRALISFACVLRPT